MKKRYIRRWLWNSLIENGDRAITVSLFIIFDFVGSCHARYKWFWSFDIWTSISGFMISLSLSFHQKILDNLSHVLMILEPVILSIDLFQVNIVRKRVCNVITFYSKQKQLKCFVAKRFTLKKSLAILDLSVKLYRWV